MWVINSKNFKTVMMVLLCCLNGLTFAYAQGQSNGISFPKPPITVQAVEGEVSALQSATNLSEDALSTIEATYGSVINELNLADQARQDAVRFERELSEAENTEKRLRAEISNVEKQLTDSDAQDNLDRSLIVLERELTTLEGELRAYRTELNQHEATLDGLLQRPVQIRETLTQARDSQASLVQQLSGLDETLDSPRDVSVRRLVQAQHYRRNVQIIALESELAGISPRQELVNLRRDLAALKIAMTENRVLQLQNKTGQRRMLLAQQVLDQAKSDLSLVENKHPFVIFYAAENYASAAKLSNISQKGGQYPHRLAKAQDSLAVAREDLRLADQLIELGNLNRASNTNLRRIQSKREPISAIKVEIAQTRKDIADQMQARILAEDQLRELTIRGNNLGEEFEAWKEEYPLVRGLSDSDLAFLTTLNNRKRVYLNQLIDAATTNIDDANILLETQMGWRTQVTNLRDLLNKTLLWTPSSQIIGKAWPGQIFRGASKIFNFDRMSSIVRHTVIGSWRFLAVTFLGIAIILAVLMSRKGLYDALGVIAGKVGSVQRDNYWHTPRAIAICAIVTLPLPVVLGVFGIILVNAVAPDPFISQLGRTCLDLAGFLWFFLTWREWNKDKALMGPHFDIADNVRKSFDSELKWFIPLAAVLIGGVTATQNSRDIDIYSGVSIFAFILVAITISLFAFRLFWGKSDVINKAIKDGSRVLRYRKLITVLFVGLPILSAILAVLGYYETARVLLSRLLFSSGLLVSSYVLYGLIRRTVLVAQRRLALKQAIERRDRMVRERQAAAEAEERGEAISATPTIDYDEIDVETISRQTSQLLNLLVTIGFAILMWLFWQDLLPALSAVDSVKIPLGSSIGPSGEIINSSLSLWTIIKSIAILTLTVMAGRNLPGFLEVFVLNGFKLDAGTRYAITTVLGYLIFAIGLAVAFTVLGLEWAKLQWIVAALGVGIGFGLQEIIANFISGLIILFERPIRIGDYVTIGDQSGTVSRIKIRATTLTDLDNREILIPNKEIITGRVTNWTLSNSVTRLKLHVGIAYGSDTDRARELMLSVLKENEKILDRPSPQVFFLGFGESSLDFELRAFISNFDDRFPVLDKLHSEVNKTLENAGISIPFPQRDIHVMSEAYPPSAAPKAKETTTKKRKPKTS